MFNDGIIFVIVNWNWWMQIRVAHIARCRVIGSIWCFVFKAQKSSTLFG